MERKPYLREIQLMRNAVPSYDAYPFDIPAIRSLSSLQFHANVTFIVGENRIKQISYEDSPQYQITKGFLDDYKRMVKMLLEN